MPGAVRTPVALRDHIRNWQAADTWIGGPGGAAVDAHVDYPVGNLASDIPGRALQTNASTAASGRVGRHFATPRKVGAAVAVGHNLTPAGACRLLGGDEVFERSLVLDGTAPNVLASTTENLTLTSAVTFRVVCRHRPVDGATDRNAEAWCYLGRNPSDDTDFDFSLQFPGTGVVGAVLRVARRSGSHVDLAYTAAEIDDGRPREWIVRINGTAAELLLEGEVVDSDTCPSLTVGSSNQRVSVGVAPARMEVYSITRVRQYVADADLDELRRHPERFQLAVPVWDMTGTLPVVDDVGPGSHTGTVGGTPVSGVGIARSKEPLFDSGTLAPWGAWSVRKALNLGTTGSVSKAVATTIPRAMTLTCWIRVDPSAIDLSVTYRSLWAGNAAATADIELRAASGVLAVGCRRTSFVSQGVTAAIVDGDWHFLRVQVLGRTLKLLKLHVWVDGVLIGTQTTGAYVSAASWSVNLAGATSTTGIEISDVRVYGAAVGSTAIDYRATVPPWDEPELVVELPLDGTYLESVSRVAATTGGDLTFVDWANPDPDADSRPGSGYGIEHPDDAAGQLPAAVIADFDAAVVKEAALLCWEPALSYYEVDTLRFLETVALSSSRRFGHAVDQVGPDAEALLGGSFTATLGPRYLRHSISLGHLSRAEAMQLRARLLEVGSEYPVLVMCSAWEPESYRLLDAVWGYVEHVDQIRETDVLGRYEVPLTIASSSRQPLRL